MRKGNFIEFVTKVILIVVSAVYILAKFDNMNENLDCDIALSQWKRRIVERQIRAILLQSKERKVSDLLQSFSRDQYTPKCEKLHQTIEEELTKPLVVNNVVLRKLKADDAQVTISEGVKETNRKNLLAILRKKRGDSVANTV